MDNPIETPKVQVRESGSSKKPLIGVLLVILAVAGYVFYSRPLAGDVDELKADVMAAETELEGLNAELETLERAKEALGLSNEVEAFAVKKQIPAGVEQDEVIRDVREIAELHEISLKSLSFGKGSTNQQGVGSLRISSSFEGNYADLVDFLEGIENNGRLFKVNSINVQLSTLDLLRFERATFTLTMEAFYQE